MDKQSARIEVDELDHATFTYEFYDNVVVPTGRSLVANVTHSCDAYILRCIQRRCNYDREMVEHAAGLIEMELLERLLNPGNYAWAGMNNKNSKVIYYVEQYERSGMADVVIIPHLAHHNIRALSTKHLGELASIINHMLTYEPFEIICVHDEFKVHPNNANHLRQQYINIFAELAESNLLNDLLSQIHGVPGTFTKLSNNLGNLIRGSNYALS